MKNHLVSLLTLLFCINSYSQISYNIDSLKKEVLQNSNDIESISRLMQAYEITNTDSAIFYANLLLLKIKKDNYNYRARVFNTYANCALLNNQLDSSIYFYKEAIEQTQLGHLHFYEGVYTSALGQAYTSKGAYKNAIDAYNTAKKLIEKEEKAERKNTHLSILYGYLGDNYSEVGLYDKALENLFHSLAITQELGDSINIGITYNSIASVYSHMNDLHKSQENNFKALQIFEKVPYPLAKGTVCYNLAENYFKLKQLDSAINYVAKAKEIITQTGSDYNLGSINNLYAEIGKSNGNYEEAIRYFTSSLEIHKKAGAAVAYGQTLLGLGEIYLLQHKNVLALNSYKEAFQIFEKEGVKKEKKECLLKMLEYFLKNKQSDSAKVYLAKYNIASADLMSTDRQNSITAQEIKYETSIKEAKIVQQEAELNYSRTKNLLYLVAGLLALLAAIGFALSYSRIKKQKNKIAYQNQEILHNNRNSLQLLISIFGRQAENETEKASALANQERLLTLTILNKLLYENDNKNQASLSEYLQRVIDAKSISSHIPIHLKFEENGFELKSSLLKNIGLIINELTSNSAKHAFEQTEKPEIAIVIGSNSNKDLCITYSDNGCGLPNDFRLASSRTSFGLDFVKDLVAQHHGKIEASSKQGTQFMITLKVE